MVARVYWHPLQAPSCRRPFARAQLHRRLTRQRPTKRPPDSQRPLRSALCHGAWLHVDRHGSASLHYKYKREDLAFAFRPNFTLKDFSDIRARTTDATFRVADAASITGVEFVLPAVMPRRFQTRNTPLEPQQLPHSAFARRSSPFAIHPRGIRHGVVPVPRIRLPQYHPQ